MTENRTADAWPDYSVAAQNARKLALMFCPEQYPHLVIFDRGGKLWIYRRWINTFDAWKGLIQEREPFPSIEMRDDFSKHQMLRLYEELAVLADEEDGFICTTCVRLKQKDESAGHHFLAHYCKSCYDEDPKTEAKVDEAQRPGFYD